MSFSQRPDVVIEVSAKDDRRSHPVRSQVQAAKRGADPERLRRNRRPLRSAEEDRHRHDARLPRRDPHSEQRTLVSYAAILYPGPEVRYPPGIEALTADPLRPELLRERVGAVLAEAIAYSSEQPKATRLMCVTTCQGASASNTTSIAHSPLMAAGGRLRWRSRVSGVGTADPSRSRASCSACGPSSDRKRPEFRRAREPRAGQGSRRDGPLGFEHRIHEVQERVHQVSCET